MKVPGSRSLKVTACFGVMKKYMFAGACRFESGSVCWAVPLGFESIHLGLRPGSISFHVGHTVTLLLAQTDWLVCKSLQRFKSRILSRANEQPVQKHVRAVHNFRDRERHTACNSPPAVHSKWTIGCISCRHQLRAITPGRVDPRVRHEAHVTRVTPVLPGPPLSTATVLRSIECPAKAEDVAAWAVVADGPPKTSCSRFPSAGMKVLLKIAPPLQTWTWL